MVYAVRGHPEDRAAFQRHGAEGGENVFQPQRYLVRPVRVQTVVAHADAQADRNVVQYGRHGQRLPTEHKEGGDGSKMQEDQEICGELVKPLAPCQFGDVFSFHVPLVNRRSSTNLSRGRSTFCKTCVIPTGCGARIPFEPGNGIRMYLLTFYMSHI